MKKIYKRFIVTVALIVVAASFMGLSTGPGQGFGMGLTGAYFDNGGAYCSMCHGGGVFTPNVQIELLDNGNPVTGYIPGNTYTVRITVSSSTGVTANTRYGFQIMSAEDGGNTDIGTWGPIPPEYHDVVIDGRTYVEHSDRLPSGIIEIPWTAPPPSTGDITFYAAGNVVNFSMDPTGDNPTTSSLTLPEFSLSINWKYFRGHAENEAVRLEWATSGQNEQGYFTLERSEDGKNFQKLKDIPMQTDEATEQFYSYIDTAPFSKNYYRISQTEVNGKTSYYKTITVSVKDDFTALHYIHGKEIVVKFAGTKNETVQASIFDLSGKKISTKSFLSQEGNNLIALPKPEINGMYIIKLHAGEKLLYTGKLLAE